MIKILKNPIDKLFYELCSNSINKINLCAPFVKYNVITNILRYKKNKVHVCLVTNINLNSFYKKASDIEAIEKLLDINQYIYNRTNLHAKYYVFDNEEAIITSGNLTTNGLTRNYEYGILTNEPTIINNITTDYSNLCKDETTGKITTNKIKKVREMLNKMNDTQTKLELPDDAIVNDVDNIYQYDINPIINSLDGWKKDVFIEINKLENSDFSTADFNKFNWHLKKLHPENHHVDDKIRQILQQLRDIGLIQFTYRGNYKRLWINKK